MGFVYLIKCNITNECYIGSSMQKNKKQRLGEHKTKNNPCVSKQIINRNNYEYIILEDILDIDKKQLRIKEQEYIDKYDCINKRKSYRTEEQKKEYYKKINKTNPKRIEYNKEYKKTDKYKECKKEYNKEYYFFNKYNHLIAEYILQINQY
jgi:hypothetical protein